jgi:hypothetical protein
MTAFHGRSYLKGIVARNPDYWGLRAFIFFAGIRTMKSFFEQSRLKGDFFINKRKHKKGVTE